MSDDIEQVARKMYEAAHEAQILDMRERGVPEAAVLAVAAFTWDNAGDVVRAHWRGEARGRSTASRV